MSDEPQQIWLSGTEEINLISSLLEPEEEDKRGTGRTSRLACKYAELAMITPFQRVRIIDHWNTVEGNRQLTIKVTKILDALNIDYSVGELGMAERDPGTLTGTRSTGKAFFVTATPKKKP